MPCSSENRGVLSAAAGPHPFFPGLVESTPTALQARSSSPCQDVAHFPEYLLGLKGLSPCNVGLSPLFTHEFHLVVNRISSAISDIN